MHGGKERQGLMQFSRNIRIYCGKTINKIRNGILKEWKFFMNEGYIKKVINLSAVTREKSKGRKSEETKIENKAMIGWKVGREGGNNRRDGIKWVKRRNK